MDFSYKFNTIWLELLNTYTDQVTILSICQITSISIEPNVFDKMIYDIRLNKFVSFYVMYRYDLARYF